MDEKTKDDILGAVLRSEPNVTNERLAKLSGYHAVTVDRGLKELEQDGFIRRHRVGRNRRIELL